MSVVGAIGLNGLQPAAHLIQTRATVFVNHSSLSVSGRFLGNDARCGNSSSGRGNCKQGFVWKRSLLKTTRPPHIWRESSVNEPQWSIRAAGRARRGAWWWWMAALPSAGLQQRRDRRRATRRAPPMGGEWFRKEHRLGSFLLLSFFPYPLLPWLLRDLGSILFFMRDMTL